MYIYDIYIVVVICPYSIYICIYISVMYVINALQISFAIIKLRFTTVNSAK